MSRCARCAASMRWGPSREVRSFARRSARRRLATPMMPQATGGGMMTAKPSIQDPTLRSRA